MRLILRADASAQMGSGHLMRCLALGQAWQDAGGTVELLTRCENGALADRMEAEGFAVRQLGTGSDWDAFETARSGGPGALVLDGYHFDAAYQKRAATFFRPLLVIDDLAGLPSYSADFVLNQNLYAADLRYACEPHVRLLLGRQWVLLRREFLRYKDWRPEVPATGRKLLITLGGSDPDNVTLQAIRALAFCELRHELETIVVAGAANPHVASLEEAAPDLHRIQVHSNPRNMPELMVWADAAIIGGGTTGWEAAFLGLPALTIVLADNQERVAAGLEKAGAAINLGWHENSHPEQIALALDGLLRSQACRTRMSQRGRQLIQGDGAAATAAALRDLL